MKTFRETIEDFKANESANCVELTYGSNGYPEFHGECRKAFYEFGVETFEEIQEIANKYPHAEIATIFWKDGWDLAKEIGWAHDLLEESADMFGDDYSEYSPNDSMFGEVIKDIVSDCDGDLFELEDKLSIVLSQLREANDAYSKAKDNQVVVMRGIEYIETMDRKTEYIRHITSNEHTAIAIVFNSASFEN